MIGGDNLPSPVRIGLTDLPNIGGGPGPGPPGSPGSGITDHCQRGCHDFRQFPERGSWTIKKNLWSSEASIFFSFFLICNEKHVLFLSQNQWLLNG